MKYLMLRRRTTQVCITVASLMVAFAIMVPALSAGDWTPGEANHVRGQLIIQVFPGTDVVALAEEFSRISMRPSEVLSQTMNIWLLSYNSEGLSAGDESALLSEIREHDDVALAQFNHFLKSPEPVAGTGLASRIGEDWALDTMHVPDAWGAMPDWMGYGPNPTRFTTCFDHEPVVAVIDKGFFIDHPVICFWFNPCEGIPGVDDDNNGYIDDIHGWNFDSDSDEFPCGCQYWHGTSVAGCVGGGNWTGVNHAVWILPIHTSSLYEAGMVEAYDYILTMRRMWDSTGTYEGCGAFIVATNASVYAVPMVEPEDVPIWCAIYDSLGATGILNSVSAGNGDSDVDYSRRVPAACPSEFLISVAATDIDDERADFSNYGATTVDLAAPGVEVWLAMDSAYTGWALFDTASGTSFSSPYVAGTISLLYDAADTTLMNAYFNNPAEVALLIKQYVFDGVDPIPSLDSITVTGGRLNVYNSLMLMHQLYISHQPLDMVNAVTSDLEITAIITSDTSLVANSLLVYYAVLPDSTTWYQETMVGTGTLREHHAYIPAQACGTVVNYYICALDYEGKADTTDIFTTEINDFAVAVAPSLHQDSALIADTAGHVLTVSNPSDCPRDYDLACSGNAWTTFFTDSTGTQVITSTGSIAAGGSVDIRVAVIVPEGASVDSAAVTFTAIGGEGIVDSALVITQTLGCCVTPGDFNHDGSADISDLTASIDFIFASGPPPVCQEEYDNDGDCTISVSDLTYFVDWMMGVPNGPPPVPCHYCPNFH